MTTSSPSVPAHARAGAPAGFSAIVRAFAPGWFASVMGTGVLALALATLAREWPALLPLAQTLHVANLVLFAVLAVPWLLRWLWHRDAVLATLRHPVQASFLPTFSIAMLVIAPQWLVFGHHVDLALAFWWPGALLTLGFSFAVLYAMFSGEHVGLEHVTPAKFIPAVGLVVIPVAGGHLLGELHGVAHDAALLINLVGLGSGAMMYVGLLGMTLYRKYLSKPAFGILTPTVWIHLAPLGVIPVSLFNVTEQLPFSVPAGSVLLPALFLWSFGIWWLVMAGLLTLSAWRRGQLPFALSWWGFTFPLGAYAGASFRLSELSGIAGMHAVGVAVTALLVAAWSLTLLRTVRGVADGSLLRPH